MSKNTTKQFATFYLCNRLYGIDVMQVQEVTRPLSITSIKLAPSYIKGLINLRGQIATAVSLRDLFGLAETSCDEQSMTVVCKIEGHLISFVVDKIGDVVEVSSEQFEETPEVVDIKIRKFMSGVYKSDSQILSVIGIDNISAELIRENEKR